MSRLNNNLIWEYFERANYHSKIARCRECDELYSYKTTTGNLKSHLKKKHFPAYKHVYSEQPKECKERNSMKVIEAIPESEIKDKRNLIWFGSTGSEEKDEGNVVLLETRRMEPKLEGNILLEVTESEEKNDESNVLNESSEVDRPTKPIVIPAHYKRNGRKYGKSKLKEDEGRTARNLAIADYYVAKKKYLDKKYNQILLENEKLKLEIATLREAESYRATEESCEMRDES